LAVVPLVLSFGGFPLSVANVIVPGALGLALAARPPRFAEEHVRGRGRAQAPPTAATIWAMTGAILMVPGLLLGPLAARLVHCLDCPPPSPLASPAIVLDVIALFLLPIVAVVFAIAGRRTTALATGLAWIGLITAGLLLGQALLSIGDVPGFAFALPVAPAAVIAILGFGLAIARPVVADDVGPWSALLCALAGIVWMAGAAIVPIAPIDFSLIQLVTLATGVVVTLGLGREFAIRPSAVTAEPPPDDEEPVEEAPDPVDTVSVDASVRRR
jgi:hypothetical protein